MHGKHAAALEATIEIGARSRPGSYGTVAMISGLMTSGPTMLTPMVCTPSPAPPWRPPPSRLPLAPGRFSIRKALPSLP